MKGWMALLELSSNVPMSCRSDSSPWGVLLKAGVQSGMNPLQSKQCILTRAHISQHHLAQPLHSCSFEQSRVPLLSPQAARSQENKISYWPSKVSWAARGARSEAGHSDKSCSLHTPTQSTGPIFFCHCCHSPFLEIVSERGEPMI